MPHRTPVRWLAFALALGSCGCAASAKPSGGRAAPAEGVPPRYVEGLRALEDAVETRDDLTARRILAHLRARVQLDRAAEEAALAEHRSDRGGGPPPRRTTARAEEVLAAFERILDGRERVDSVELALRRLPAKGEASQLVLEVRGEWPSPLVLRPGPALLATHQVALTPEGRELVSMWTQGVGRLHEIRVDPEGPAEIPLGTFPERLPRDSIALRTVWQLDLRAGEVRDAGASFPAMNVPVEAAESILVAPFFPAAPVEPEELVRYVSERRLRPAPLLERTVRIDPERWEETLDALTPFARSATREELDQLAPALRWLSRATGPVLGPADWRTWMLERARQRGEKPVPVLDLGAH